MLPSLDNQTGNGLYRQDKLLYVERNAQLPSLCIKCGRPDDGNPLKKVFTWHTPWLFLLVIFPGVLIYIIVALIVQKKFDLAVPLCEVHKQKRRSLLWAAALSFLGGFPAAFLAMAIGVPTVGAMLLSAVLILSSLVFWALGSGIIRPAFIGKDHATFAGAGDDFLTHLTALPPA